MSGADNVGWTHEARRLVDTESEAVVIVLSGLMDWAESLPSVTGELRAPVALLRVLMTAPKESQ